MYAHLLQRTKMGIKEEIWSKIRKEEKDAASLKDSSFIFLPAMLDMPMMKTHANKVKALCVEI